MPKSKNTRKSAGTRKTMTYKGAALPTLDLPPDAATLKQLADMAFHDLNMVVEGKGNMKNWMGINYRLHVGYFASQDYFSYDDTIDTLLYRGIVALRCAMIRAGLTGELGFLVWEFDAIKVALDVTSDLMRHLRLSESMAVHYKTDDYFSELVEENMKSYPGAAERAAMLLTLQQERAEVAANEQEPSLEEAA